jgi:hypothetical protein
MLVARDPRTLEKILRCEIYLSVEIARERRSVSVASRMKVFSSAVDLGKLKRFPERELTMPSLESSTRCGPQVRLISVLG